MFLGDIPWQGWLIFIILGACFMSSKGKGNSGGSKGGSAPS